MKTDKTRELFSKSKAQLGELGKNIKNDIAKMQIEITANRLKDTAQIGEKKKMLARIFTILKIKELT